MNAYHLPPQKKKKATAEQCHLVIVAIIVWKTYALRSITIKI